MRLKYPYIFSEKSKQILVIALPNMYDGGSSKRYRLFLNACSYEFREHVSFICIYISLRVFGIDT